MTTIRSPEDPDNVGRAMLWCAVAARQCRIREDTWMRFAETFWDGHAPTEPDEHTRRELSTMLTNSGGELEAAAGTRSLRLEVPRRVRVPPVSRTGGEIMITKRRDHHDPEEEVGHHRGHDGDRSTRD
jgi:hypothetical protein